MKLKDSKILISGGSLGIGKAIAKTLISHEAKVIITGRNKVRLYRTANKINAIPFVADVTDGKALNKLFKFINDKWSSLDVLINNAGTGADRISIDNINYKKILEVYNVNVFGLIDMTKHAVKIFKKQNYGNIINIGSTASIDGYENGSIYVSSKFALKGLTKVWQLELSKFNVRVSLVNTGNVATAWGSKKRAERKDSPKLLSSNNVASLVRFILEQEDKAFIPEVVISPLYTFKQKKPLYE